MEMSIIQYRTSNIACNLAPDCTNSAVFEVDDRTLIFNDNTSGTITRYLYRK